MKIVNQNYSIEFIEIENKILFKGNLRLQSIDAYEEIINFIFERAINTDKILILDFSNLTIINSSGIASIGLFLIKMREYNTKIKIYASKFINWHVSSLRDFKDINENVEIEYIVHH